MVKNKKIYAPDNNYTEIWWYFKLSNKYIHQWQNQIVSKASVGDKWLKVQDILVELLNIAATAD